MNDMCPPRASVVRRSGTIIVALISFLGCRVHIDAREGDLDELLAPDNDAAVSLETTALKVERIETELAPQSDEYRIGPNDVLNITVIGHEELSSARDFNRGIVGTIVKKDGQIYMPILGPIPAAGYTIEEFHAVFDSQLKTYLQSPQFTIDILKYESQKFFILGEVNSPGAFPVDGDTTLLEAIGLAKGVRPEASLEGAYVVRDGALLPINLADLLLRADTRRNIYMRNGDLIYFPSSANERVYVLGEVHRPGAIPLPRGALSLAQALAEAGGLVSVEASQRNIKLIRGSWQEPTVYTLDWDTVLSRGEAIALKPGDRIVVQPTGLTTASRYMQQILPFLVGLDTGTRIYERMKAQ